MGMRPRAARPPGSTRRRDRPRQARAAQIEDDALSPEARYAQRRERNADDDVLMARGMAAQCAILDWSAAFFEAAKHGTADKLDEPAPPAWACDAARFFAERYRDHPRDETDLFLWPRADLELVLIGEPMNRAFLNLADSFEAGPDELRALVSPLVTAFGELPPIACIGDMERGECRILGAALVLSRAARRRKIPSRPRGRARDFPRVLFQLGIEHRYEREGLGKPSADDLTDLAMHIGMDAGPRARVRKFWADRMRLAAAKKSSPAAISSPV
jgi:hypothetical protein